MMIMNDDYEKCNHMENDTVVVQANSRRRKKDLI